MQIMILDKNKITKFTLPNEVDGSFNFEYKHENVPTKKTINIEAHENNWVFMSNGEVNAFNQGIEGASIALVEYSYFPIKVINLQEDLLIFPMPTNEKNCYRLMTGDQKVITIGNNDKNIICYQDEHVGPTHAQIINENGMWFICAIDEKFVVYLNDNRVIKEQLKMGDIIFIYGMKILWLTNFMYVYNFNNKVSITNAVLPQYNEEEINNQNYNPVSESDMNLELYKINDYFFHTLKIKSKVNSKDLEIDPPPAKQEMAETPLIITLGGSVTMLASAFVSINSILNGLKTPGNKISNFIPQIVMVGAMLFTSFLMPQITRFYQKGAMAVRERRRQREYKRYLKEKVNEIETALSEQKRILEENNPALRETYQIAFASQTRSRWSREVNDEDFLNIRLGMGTFSAKLDIKPINDSFTMDKDDLKDLAISVANKEYELENAPVVFSLLENRISALTIDGKFEQSYIDGLILQLTTFHSAGDLKIVFLLNDPNISRWDYVKYMPHTLGAYKDIRFFATNLKEIKAVCSYLEEEFNFRRNAAQNATADMYQSFEPYYLIITNDYFAVKNNAIIESILNQPINLGYSLLIVEHSIQRIPSQCNVFLQIFEPESYILLKETGDQIKFVPEYDGSLSMRSAAIPLAGIPLLPPGSAAALPNTLTFLEMFNVSKIEQLNASNRWRINNPTTSLQTPVGVQTNGEQFYLDLHEKYHGPHGLVAGTTGSGKSEFLITFLLSLAINYHPYEVQFVIIDYKGGGLAGAFENRATGAKIPHLVGTITNLDVSEMNRTLVSINSEIKRRQKVFNDARDKLGEGTIDIYKYQQFYRNKMLEEPMAHLFIVSDEFAELKAQQPDFMDELISIARIGRSLGIHLILATQKPSGVVTDQIWSNSKFKVCLKVQDANDSIEMLKRPEAASLKEAGRFFLQVGYDEYFDIGQAAWAGAKYVPTNKIIKKVDDSISFLDNVGYPYKTINDDAKATVSESKVDQLTSVTKYLIDLALKEKCNVKQLWRSAIPGEIFLNDLKTKYNYKRESYYINPIIGEYDNPRAQFQGVLTLDITGRGNTLIYGMEGSGKENLLSTIIYSVCTNHHPEEVNFYVIDLGAETLRMYNEMPHVADICSIDEPEKIEDLIKLITKEISRRKKLFVDYNGNYTNYCKNSGATEPSIIIILNNYESFVENFFKLEEQMAILFRDSNKFGIYFVVTTSTENSMRTRVSDTFSNKICLQMAGEDAYRSTINAPKSLKPLSIFGRGLVALEEGQYEFQTAYICNPIEINTLVKNTVNQFKQYNYIAKKIPVLPEDVTLDYVINSLTGLDSVPIGISYTSKEPYVYNFKKSKINVISTFDVEANTNFFYALIKLLSSNQNINLRVIDLLGLLDQSKLDTKIFNNHFDEIMLAIYNEFLKEASLNKDIVYIFIGISALKSKLDEKGREMFTSLFTNIKNYANGYFIFADSYDEYKNFINEPWYSTEVDKKIGIWLGPGVSDQYAINFPNISMNDREIKDPAIGFVSSKTTYTLIKKIVLTAEDSNE